MSGSLQNFTENLELSQKFISEFENRIGLEFISEEVIGNLCFANNSDEIRDDFRQVFTPIDLFDYIYAVQHSSGYRKKHPDFQKINLAEIPYPKYTETFWKLVRLGKEIRQIHLMENLQEDKLSETSRLMHEIDKVMVE